MSSKKHSSLHGNAPDKCRAALIIIDLINDLNFHGGRAFLKQVRRVSKNIALLKERCVRAKIPVIYVNDNFGRWRSDFKTLLQHCLRKESIGKSAVALIKPEKTDYFVLKPKHSGFFATTLHTLLDYLQVETVILTGLTGDICVLFTANDAYMRDYTLVVPSDCVASKSIQDNKTAFALMRRVLKASTVPSGRLRLSKFKQKRIAR